MFCSDGSQCADRRMDEKGQNMKNKKCISLTLAAILLLTGCGAKGRDSSASADNSGKKVLTFGCQMYTDGIVNSVTDENGGLWNFNVYLNQRHLAFGLHPNKNRYRRLNERTGSGGV